MKTSTLIHLIILNFFFSFSHPDTLTHFSRFPIIAKLSKHVRTKKFQDEMHEFTLDPGINNPQGYIVLFVFPIIIILGFGNLPHRCVK
jgi:membrane protein insertase Oxa1/YidC/SpoIIIJ